MNNQLNYQTGELQVYPEDAQDAQKTTSLPTGMSPEELHEAMTAPIDMTGAIAVDFYGGIKMDIGDMFERNVSRGKKVRKDMAKNLHAAYPKVFGKKKGKTKKPYVYVAHAIQARTGEVPIDRIQALVTEMCLDRKTAKATFVDPERIEKGMSHETIVPLDSSLVAEAEAVVLYLGAPSMGAQYEIMLARHLGIPIFVVTDIDTIPSAFVEHFDVLM